jgi:pilus assembly protein FimV
VAKAAPVEAAEAAPEARHEAPAATRKPVAPKELAEAIAAKLPGARVAPKKEAAAHAVASAASSAEAAPAAAALPAGVAKTPPPKGSAAPAACAPQSGITSRECAALDEHNAALSTKLVELEGKLKVLQMAVASKGPAAGEGAAAPAAAPAAAHAAAAAPASASVHASSASAHASSASAHASASASAAAKISAASAAAKALAAADAALGLPPASASASASVKTIKVLPKLKYKKEKPEKPADTGMKAGTMVAIGAGVLALLGGLGWWLMKRRKAKGSAPLKIWQGWRKKKAPEATPEPAQPLHEVMPESLLEPE